MMLPARTGGMVMHWLKASLRGRPWRSGLAAYKPLPKRAVDRRFHSGKHLQIPPFSVSLEVNVEGPVFLDQSLKKPICRRTGAELTYTDLLFRALALSPAHTPAMNAVWEAGEVCPRTQIVLGLAVATDRGIVAPVLAGVERLPLVQLVTRRAELTDKARQSRLTFAYLDGGVGTLSNLGRTALIVLKVLSVPHKASSLPSENCATGLG